MTCERPCAVRMTFQVQGGHVVEGRLSTLKKPLVVKMDTPTTQVMNTHLCQTSKKFKCWISDHTKKTKADYVVSKCNNIDKYTYGTANTKRLQVAATLDCNLFQHWCFSSSSIKKFMLTCLQKKRKSIQRERDDCVITRAVNTINFFF